jgi:PII-like signaling protein
MTISETGAIAVNPQIRACSSPPPMIEIIDSQERIDAFLPVLDE